MATLDLAGIITRVCADLRAKFSNEFSKVSFHAISRTGTKIATIAIDGVSYGIYVPLVSVTGTLSKGSGASSYTGQVRKYGRVVQLNLNQIKLSAALGAGSTSGTVTTIPTGYRPNYQILVPWASSGAAYGYATIATGGTVTMRNCSSTSLATSAASTIACTYIVN